MDTIIYFYLKKDLREPVIDVKIENNDKAGKKTEPGLPKPQQYKLIRVGLRLEGENWFGKSAGQTVPKEDQALFETKEPEMPDRKGIFGALRQTRWRRQEKRRREEAQRRLEQMLLAREAQLGEIKKQMRLAAERILKRADEEELWGYVCQEGLKNSAVWKEWLKYFPVKEFDGYTRALWAKQLLSRAVHSRFVVLGCCEDICELIESCAGRMKALRWILPEQECTQRILDFVEDFYIEYGLAAALQTVPGHAAYRRIRLDCAEPTNILDFTGESHVAAAGLAKESVWLDMQPSEEKRRRIAERNTEIRYFSLKERWSKA